MALFSVPNDPTFNTTMVTEIKESDYILASFVNGYYQTFLNNDQYLNNQVRQANANITNLEKNVTQQFAQTKEDIANAQPEETTDEDINTALNYFTS